MFAQDGIDTPKIDYLQDAAEPAAERVQEALPASFWTEGAVQPDSVDAALLAPMALPQSPYRYYGASPAVFYGRQADVHRLLQPHTHWAVYGGRGIGKTSLLLHVAQMQQRKGQAVLYLDASIYARCQDLLTVLAHQWGIPSACEQPQYFFARWQHRCPRQLHLYLDEVDGLWAQAVERKALQDLLRTAVQQLQWQVVIAGGEYVARTMRRPDPGLSWLSPLSLGPLDAAAVQALVKQPLARSGLHVEDAAALAAAVFHLSGGQPALVQRMCHQLVVAHIPRSGRLPRSVWGASIGSHQVLEFARQSYLQLLSPIELDLCRRLRQADFWHWKLLQRLLSEPAPLAAAVDTLLWQNIWRRQEERFSWGIPLLRIALDE